MQMNEWARARGPRGWLMAVGVAALVLGLTAAANAPARTGTRASRGHEAARPTPRGKPGPPGFWYGTDSFPVTVSGSAPYPEPQIGGKYGGYIGMTGNWATWQHCGDKLAWSDTNAADANTNFSTYHLGIGTGVYWFMGGPGVDPHYDGTTTEAYDWGKQQAIRTLSDVAKLTVTYPVIFADVEIPGNAPGISPAPDNGWNSVYTSPRSGKVSKNGIPASVDRADFNGFFDEIAHNSSFTPGVYSSAPVWTSIFGTGGYSHIRHTFEWTYLGDTSSLSHTPDGWCLRNTSTCAEFFGGVTSSDRDAEADLRQDHQGQGAQRGERAREHQAGRGDHPARGREPGERALAGARALGLLADPGHQEDVVVDAQRDQEHEREQRHRHVRARKGEQVPEHQRGQAERGREGQHHRADQHQRRDDRPQQQREDDQHDEQHQ